MINRLFFVLVVVLLPAIRASGATFYARATGTFGTAATWSTAGCGGVASAVIPGAADSVVICNGFTVSVAANATVRSVTILNGGILQCGTTGGGANRILTLTGTFNVQDGGLYIHNSNQAASTTIFAGTEIFSPSSTVRLDSWSGTADPVVTGVNSNFGNLILNWNPGAFYWNNQGLGFVRTVQGSLTIQGGCATYLDAVAGNTTFTIGQNLVVNSSFLRFKQAVAGDVVLNIGGQINITGTSFVYGVYSANGNLNCNAASVNLSGGTTYGIYNGDGRAVYTIPGAWTQTAGEFRGIQNNTTFTAGIASFQLGSMNFTGGTFLGNYGCHVGSQTISFVVNGNMSVSFATTADLFAINRLATLSTTPTTAGLNMTVTGNLTIGGVLGEFNSNNGTGAESITINGNASISNGNNYFNVVPTFGANGHTTNLSIAGTLTVSGGNTYLSSETGTLTATVTGGVTISGGTLSAKGQSGAGTVNLMSFYNQSAGNFFLHNNATAASANAVAVTVNGDFTQSGGVINFSNNTGATAINTITLNGANYNLGAAGSMTRAGAGTAATFGMLFFNRIGTISFSRSGTHSIQQVKQVVMPSCTLDVVSGNVQIASHATAATDYFTVSGLAILDLRGNQVFSNALAANSGITVADNGRLRTTHASGLYNNTTTAALNNTGALNYFLGAISVVEYYGSANQIMTGINLGLATAAQHKYGIVEVNQATPGIWVAPTNLPSASGNVYMRTELRLTAGELNLANAAGNPTSGGRVVIVENGLAAGITRTAGWIRSETSDFSGAIDWIIGSNTGAHIIPFAYSSTQYLPETYNLTSGTAGTVRFSTYHTPATNLPWPPLVNNLNSIIGLTPDNRDATSDRFWLISSPATPVATVTFTYLVSELPIAPYNVPTLMQAQHYNTSTNKWQPALPGQTANPYTVTVPGITNQQIWTLSNSASPLPVELLSFIPECKNGTAKVEWYTATETNNDFFTILRSTDGTHFTELGRVTGAGNSNVMLSYRFTDSEAQPRAYYKLTQTDYDGHTEELAVAPLNCRNPEAFLFTAFCNPQQSLQLNYDSPEGATYQLEITESAGRKVYHGEYFATPGFSAFEVPVALKAGVYFVNTWNALGRQTVKVVIP